MTATCTGSMSAVCDVLRHTVPIQERRKRHGERCTGLFPKQALWRRGRLGSTGDPIRGAALC